MKGTLLFLLSVLFVSVCVAAPIPRNADNEIEYSTDSVGSVSSATFLLKNELFTVADLQQLTVKQFLNTQLVKTACNSAGESQLYFLDASVISDSLLINYVQLESRSAEADHSLLLKCSNGRSFNFITFKLENHATDMRLLSEEREQLQQAAVKAGRSFKVTEAGQDYPINAIDLMPDTVKGYAHYAAEFMKVHWGKLHAYPSYSAPHTGIYSLQTGAEITSKQLNLHYKEYNEESEAVSTPIEIAMVADWGAGTLEADYVQQVMMQSSPSNATHWTIHLGDIYYLGTEEETMSNALGVVPHNVSKAVTWPHGSLGSLAVAGNHEWYSRGFGYFDYFLPTLGSKAAETSPEMAKKQQNIRSKHNFQGKMLAGQNAGYWMLQDNYWRLIGLDTGLNSFSEFHVDNANTSLPEAMIDWLKNTVKLSDPNDKRGIIILTHHQPFSGFESAVYPAAAIQLAELIPTNRSFLWLFGHEHRLALYNHIQFVPSSLSKPLNMIGRCIGNAGFPTRADEIPSVPGVGLNSMYAYDDRLYEYFSGLHKLDVGYNGFLRETFDQNLLTIDYRTLQLNPHTGRLDNNSSDLIITEQFSVDAAGNVNMNFVKIVDPHITVVKH
jgi:hypothetical protein